MSRFRLSGAWLKALIYSCFLTALYYNSFFWLVTQDWSRDDYSSSYIIPAVIAYLIWEKRRQLADTLSRPSWWGLLPVLAGTALFWLGELSGEYFSLYISAWLTVFGLCWLHFGWHKLKLLLFPLCFALGMFPLPHFLYGKISFNLKLASSYLGVKMIQISGLSAYREGNVIDLGFTQLQVVDACNGLRYLIPLILLGLLLAYFFRGSLWQKILLVVSTLPISLLTNSLRIASVGILYRFWGPVVAEGFFHDFSGWFIFNLSLALLLLEMALLRIFFGPAKTPKAPALAQQKLFSEPAQVRPFWRQARFLVPVLLLATSLSLTQGVNFREQVPVKQALDGFPLQLGDWQGQRQYFEQQIIDTLDLTEYIVIDYVDDDRHTVNFYTAYYASQGKGEAIHSPETCLPGSGWRFREQGEYSFALSENPPSSMRVFRGLMQQGDSRQLTYFWFPQRGRVLTNIYELKFYTLLDALIQQRTDGALVRLVTPLAAGEAVEQADRRLQKITRQLVPVLDQYLPGKEE